jgi:23S rRNA pseudouridine1911/1915/1917 synthase
MSGEVIHEDQEVFELIVSDEDRIEFKRLDHYLTSKLPQFSRSTLKRLFEDEDIFSETPLSLNKMPPGGTKIEIDVPPPLPSELTAENIPLDILFEDSHLLVINKPAGLVVHPAPGHYEGTLVNAVLYHCPDLRGIGAQKRPGIVHRLDRGTSGVMVVAKDQPTHEGLVQLFSVHNIERKYEALIAGCPNNLSGKIETTLGRHPTQRQKMAANVKNGKKSVTYYSVQEKFKNSTHIELRLETGRTHQIRVHMSQVLQTPIICDPVYGNAETFFRKLVDPLKLKLSTYPYQLLHAKTLGFTHPVTKKDLFFTAPPPDIFLYAIEALRAQ